MKRRDCLKGGLAALAAPALILPAAPARAAAWSRRADPRIAEAAPDLAAFLDAEARDMEAGAAAAPGRVDVLEQARAITPRFVSVVRRITREGDVGAGMWFESVTWDRSKKDFVLLDALVSPDAEGWRAIRGIAKRLYGSLQGRGLDGKRVMMATAADPLVLQNFTLEPSTVSGRIGGLAFRWGAHELGGTRAEAAVIPQEAFRDGLLPEIRDQFAGGLRS